MSEYLLPGQIVKIDDRFYEIETFEAFTYETTSATGEFSSVATGAESGFKDMENLEPRGEPAELYQLRWGVQDGGDYYMKFPPGTERFGVHLKKDVGHIDAKINNYLAMNEDFEIWLIHNDYPSINCDNDTGYSLTPKVWFQGMKYNYKHRPDYTLERPPDRYRTILRGGVKTT